MGHRFLQWVVRHLSWPGVGVSSLSKKRADTVGQPQSTEMGVPNMLSLKAKKLRKLLQAKVLLER
jgi:hypothetical protein